MSKLERLKERALMGLIEDLKDPRLFDRDTGLVKTELLHKRVEALVEMARRREKGISLTQEERSGLITEIMDEILGFGPIEVLIRDPSVSQIMVNGPKHVYVERNGKLELTGVTFKDNAHILHSVEKILAPTGRRISESEPFVDARIRGGARINVTIPPLSLTGPVLTILKVPSFPSMEDWLKLGSMSQRVADFLIACMKARLNIVISGGTSTGKTTLLNVLASIISPEERVVTIEDTAELHFPREHLIRLEAKHPNVEGKGAITIRDLVKNALRMRPDRLIVGEVRGGETLDMIQAMNTGHEGSLTNVHSNSPLDTLSRLETLMLMGGVELPLHVCRAQVVSALDLIIHLRRFPDGSRKVINVTEVCGMEDDRIVLNDLFAFKEKGLDGKGRVMGEFKLIGRRPGFYWKFEERGIKLAPDMFLK